MIALQNVTNRYGVWAVRVWWVGGFWWVVGWVGAWFGRVWVCGLAGGWVGGSIGERVGEWGLVCAGVGGFGRVWVGVWVCVAKSKTNLAAMSVCQKTVCAIPCFVGA